LASRENNEYIGDRMTAVLNIKESDFAIDESDEDMKEEQFLPDQVILSHAS